ncbi:FAD-dependent oxidoreductase [Robertkochia marina]|uniref:FAD-dependent oxidoreductase n=1 Tax=Robertkochia marina TaxID=1227945 RepID=A0A4S3M224_9FLAO|nr:FAD-dependent oxidoreductase [Robertkochia marina]THD69073.1 FAD-dependent oxidoreductase [Robertkochia marina]TRZ44897.1 FAD-dependent oxidoreductase [Robertkochia marina]
MGKKIIVIGGGIVGLSTAYYLLKEGHEVIVVDKGDINSGASFVNAGYLTPSHVIPLAAPGMMAKGLKWMFNSSSPFYMKPRLDPDFLKWAWYFNRSSTAAKVKAAIPVIRDINLLSKDLYTDLHDSRILGDFQLDKRGLLMLYKTEKAAKGEEETARIAAEKGLEVKVLNKSELNALEPGVDASVLGAVHYECDAHTTPGEVMKLMLEYLKKNGATILTNTPVTGIHKKNNKVVSIACGNETLEADFFVMSAGSWSSNLVKELGVSLSLQAGKGYRINVAEPTGINYPAVLCEGKVAVTPMRGFTRFAGTMEFSGINQHIRKERVEAIAARAREYYSNLKIGEKAKAEAQCGLRPVSPDGLPYIGWLGNYSNMAVATGHAMMGWSLGPATGKLISELIDGRKTSMDLTPFDPGRKF